GLVVTEKKSCAGLLTASGLSVITACKLTSLSRASFYRRRADWREKDKAVIDAIHVVLSESPQAGFWKCYYRLRFKGYIFNHKRVYRVYCRLGLNLKRKVKKTLPKREKNPLSVVNKPNIQWAMDFVHDALYCGKRFRTLNIIDEGTRECLAIEVDTSLPANSVIRVLE
ncbi:IS3 family transposase, partial [Yersinia enterocolitica]